MTGVVACYVRVSTDKQTSENQEPDILRMVTARGHGLAPNWYRETGSAAKARPVFARMMEDARVGRFRMLYVWSLDRFGRSMFKNLHDLRLLVEKYNVTVVSVREPWVESTSDPMTRTLLLSVLGWVAEFERERLIQRTNAGIARAKAKGTKLGRPSVGVPDAACAYLYDRWRNNGGKWVPWRRAAELVKAHGWGVFSPFAVRRACAKWVEKTKAENAEKTA